LEEIVVNNFIYNELKKSRQFPRVESLPPYPLGEVAHRVHTLRSIGHDVIDCSQLNPNLPPPQVALDKLVQASLLPHNHRYSSSGGISALRQAFAQYYDKMFNVKLNADSEVVVTAGTKEGIAHLLLGILAPGDTVLVTVPAYPVHTAAVCLAGAGFVGVPLWGSYDAMKESDSILSSSSDYFFSRLKNRYFQTWPRPRLLLTSFPHNPTTTIVTQCFYERLLEFAIEHSVFLINDFAHGDLYFSEERKTSLLSIEGALDYCIEFYSLSKGFSLPGWRIGVAVGNPTLLSALKAVKSYVDFGTFQPLQIASAALLEFEVASKESGHGVISEYREIYHSRRDIVSTRLEALGWDVFSSHATPFIWARLPEKFQEIGSASYCTNLLEHEYVACSPGSGFDNEQFECVRFSLLENESRLREMLKRIERFQSTFIV